MAKKVIRFEGRLLASRFNPSNEAREWIDRRPEFLAKVRNGDCARHRIRTSCERILRRTTANLLVIDTNEQFLTRLKLCTHCRQIA